MSYHIQNDNKNEETEKYKGQDLPWTLYDGPIIHGFYETLGAAKFHLTEIANELRNNVKRLRRELDDAEDELDELESIL